ncbi:hypothetical protein yaldo0001_13920 [Yersinia aldovae ATCC 35236]|nr:hypothetical protein yaldo0001_13920 [Yersinia aldovae ATCC 35236]
MRGNQANIVTNNRGFNAIGLKTPILGVKSPTFNMIYPYPVIIGYGVILNSG